MPKSRHGKSKHFKQEKRQQTRVTSESVVGQNVTATASAAPAAATPISMSRPIGGRRPAAAAVVKPPNILPELRLVAILSVFILAVLVVLHLVL